jgi:hypothetical protein
MTTTTRSQGERPQVVVALEARGRGADPGGRRRPPAAGRRPAAGAARRAGGPQAAMGAGPQATAAAAALAPPRPQRRPRPQRTAVPGYQTAPGRPRPRVPPRAVPDQRPPTAQPGPGGVRAARRPPFVFLVVGLLGGGLVCLLLLNTVLAAGAFQMTSLQQANAALARQQQELKQQIAYAQSPNAIAHRARQLGMVPVSQPRVLNLKSGHIYSQAPRLVSGVRN